MLAVHARKTHKTLWAQWARMTVEPVMTGMATHATWAGRAGRAADGDLLFDMLVKLVYAGDITIEMVYLKRERMRMRMGVDRCTACDGHALCV